MSNKVTTRNLAEGAMMAALAAIFMLAGNVPFIGVVILLFSSIPVTVSAVRNTPFVGALTAVLATLIVGLVFGPIAAVSGGLQYMLLGWVLGYMLYHHKSGSKTMQAGVVTASLAAVAMLLLSLALMGFTPDAIAASLESYKTEMLDVYQSTGMIDMMTQQGMSKTQVMDMLQQSMRIVINLMPAMLIISRAVMAIITYFLTIQVLKKLRIRVPRIQNFQKWGLPFAAVWGLIVVWALWLASDYIKIGWVNILTLNCMVLYGALLVLDGFSLTCYWFKLNQMSTGMKVVCTLFVLFFFSGFLIACILTGLADLLFDFRKLRVDNKNVRKG